MYDVWKAVQVLNRVELPDLFQHHVESARRYLISADESSTKEERMRGLKFAYREIDQVSKLATIKRRFPGEIEKLKQASDMVNEYISDEYKKPMKAIKVNGKGVALALKATERANTMLGGKRRIKI